jgi:hypothetical protein
MMVAACALIGVGLFAQFRSAKAPSWARFVDGSMSWAVTPNRWGPSRFVSFALTARSGDGAPRYAMLEGAGAHEWPHGAAFSIALMRGGVFVYVERPANRGLVARAPAWVVWGSGVALMTIPLMGYARRRRAIRRGLCAHCRYDLTGIAQGKPCPECGFVRSKSVVG